MTKLKLRCYVCGKPIKPGDFALVSSGQNEVDRAFVVHGESCLKQVREEHPHRAARLHG